MNKRMLEDLLKCEKHKTKILSILLAVFICLFVAMTIFAFCSFDIDYEETTDISYDIEQGADTKGDNSGINQDIDLSQNDKSSDSIYICGTIILCVTVITAGVVVYGKSKSKSKNNNKKDKET